MTREKILKEILALKNSNVLLELPTGFGKSKIAIERAKKLGCKNILLIVNRVVHKDNWKQEFDKWWKDRNTTITMTTYVSLPKYIGNYDMIIADEAHHLSERCREALCSFTFKYSILLSATVSKELKDELKEVFDNLYIYKKTLRNAIDNAILPDPKVYLLPLYLNTENSTEIIWKNQKAKGAIIESSYAERWNYIRQRNNPVKIYCTQKQYINDLNGQIDYWKQRYMRSRRDIAKNKWLKLCSDRLKWLSDKKIPYVQRILSYLEEYRTLIFCNSIEQTELLGEYCINSKNKASAEYLDLFNKGEINHITACNILNEGRRTCPYLSNSVEVIYKNKLRKKA